jgi:hypothetical protein
MPYELRKVKGGTKVVSPNHPQGFSKKPQTLRMAKAQLRAIYANTKGK